ncbi:MAG TPA: glycosyltransferase [Clostridia bacterium]|nr:glycosyltransferase [Clostridia bacterium]
MFKNILIISSDVTGHGHKSITESLLEQLKNYPETNVKVVDGFALGGNIGLRAGKMYGSITRTSKDVWKRIWDITVKRPSLIIELSELAIYDRFVRLLQEMQPDIIISTHPNYNASVTNILARINYNVPMIAVVADPVTISPLWCNPQADYTICPTEEAEEVCIKCGVPKERVRMFGFPVRQRFTEHLCRPEKYNGGAADTDYPLHYPVRFMIMSGGEGSGNMSRLAKILLKNFDCSVKILCGRNKLMKKALEHTLPEKYKDRIDILGFTENVQDIMLSTDIMFTRASPNTMIEAVMCNVPLVITGALPGQEEGNPDFAVKHGLGVVCTESKELKYVVSGLLADNFKQLNEIKKAQIKYRNPYAAKDITDFIMNI